ncbi:MAG: hypothetical protein R2772_04790 [Chitinophagales bacterium]
MKHTANEVREISRFKRAPTKKHLIIKYLSDRLPSNIESILQRIENIDPIKYAYTRNFVDVKVSIFKSLYLEEYYHRYLSMLRV